MIWNFEFLSAKLSQPIAYHLYSVVSALKDGRLWLGDDSLRGLEELEAESV